jgi:uncharacterized membrane protein YqjE
MRGVIVYPNRDPAWRLSKMMTTRCVFYIRTLLNLDHTIATAKSKKTLFPRIE